MTPIALDTETTLASNAEPVPRLVCVSFASATGVRLRAAHDPRLEAEVAEAFRLGVISANLPFDIYTLLRAFPSLLPLVVAAYRDGKCFDVLTREKLIDIALGQHFMVGRYGLGAVAERRAGIIVDKNDEWRLRYGELLGLEIEQWPEAARKYAIGDACAHFGTYVAQEEFRGQYDLDVFENQSEQARKHVALYTQTLRGIRTDPEQVERVASRLEAQLTHHTLSCLDAGLVRVGGTKKAPKFTGNKKAAAAAVVTHCEATGRKVKRTDPSKTFPEGQVALDEKTLKNIGLPDGHPLESFRLRLAIQSTQTKTIPVLRCPIIRTRYEELVGSGRTSSSGPQGRRKVRDLEPWEWVGSNLQNQNRKGGFRECLVPTPEHVFVISDWTGAELVALAQIQIDLFGRSALGDMLRDGRDPHSEFGARMLGIPIADFDRYDDGPHAAARQGAKAWNFGKPGGMGKARFIAHARDQYGVEVTPEEYYRHDRTWRETFPEMELFFEYVSNLEGPDGITVVQHRSNRIRGGLRFPDACNTHFQGLAGDAAGTALWRLWCAGLDERSPLFGGLPLVSPNGNVGETGQVLFVHDENVTAVRREVAEQALAAQEKIMIESFAEWCPAVPIKVESTIAERYTK